jgi:hypothetical protein
VGLGDDFSYVWTAKRLVETGHILYTGWSSPALGYLVYLAAFLIKLIGKPYVASRVAALIITLSTAAVLHRLFLRVGVKNFNSVIATCGIVLSPACFVYSASFMTDMPGMFATVVCIYLCIRAVQATGAKHTILWLALACGTNLFFGSARQIAFLGALVLVPTTGWHLRNRSGVLAASRILWCLCAFVIGCFVSWFGRQPYTLHEAIFYHYDRYALRQAIYVCVGLSVTLLPILAGFVYTARYKQKPTDYLVATFAAFLGTMLLVLLRGNNLDGIFSDLMMGAITVPRPVELCVIWLCGNCLSLAMLWARQSAGHRQEQEISSEAISFRTLCRLLLPMACVYMLVLVTRQYFFTRYLGPMLMVSTLLLCKLHAERSSNARFNVAVPVLMIAAAFVSVAATHDAFREQDARRQVERWYLAQGLAREQLEASMASDGWYELSSGGYINDARIRVPGAAYVADTTEHNVQACHIGFMSYTPAIRANYVIGEIASHCVMPVPLYWVEYKAWMPPHVRSRKLFLYAEPYRLAGSAFDEHLRAFSGGVSSTQAR